jgi:hypothetical protein
MIKLIDPSSWDFGEPVAQLVDVCRNGRVDGDWAVKRAAAGVFRDIEMEPRPGHQLIHLIGMGDSEVFGQNRNGDAFPGYPRKLQLPEGDWETVMTKSGALHRKGPDTFSDTIKYGSDTQAKTFKDGHVYRDHRNRPDKGDKIHGEVRDSVHNAKMRRVEIIIEVPENGTWREDLESISKDIPIAFSMACKIPYDICNSCGHKAPQPGDYCPCMANQLGDILQNGHTVGCWNEKPEHFDISRVRRPADRVAWSLYRISRTGNEKRASADLASDPLFYPWAEEASELPGRFSPKHASLKEKLAQMEKRVVFYPSTKLLGKQQKAPATKVATHQLPRYWKALGSAGIILPLEKWACTCGLELSQELLTAAAEHLPTVYSSKWAPAAVQDRVYEAYAGYPGDSFQKIASDLSPALSCLPEHVMTRTILASVQGAQPTLHIKLATSDTQAEAVAHEYAMYQLSSLETASKANPGLEDFLCEQCVLQNVLRNAQQNVLR